MNTTTLIIKAHVTSLPKEWILFRRAKCAV